MAAPTVAAVPTRPPIGLIFAVTVTGILGNTLITAPLPDILHEFGQPDDHAGWITAAATVPGIVVAPIIGLLADRYGRRAVLAPCLVVFGAFGVAAAFSPSFEVLLLCRLGQGFGSAGLINLAVVLVGDHWSGDERARVLGLNSAVLTGSITVLPVAGGLLAHSGGWRWSFAPYALALVTAWLVWRLLTGDDAQPSRPIGEQLHDVGAVLRIPAVALSISIGFVLFALIFGLFLTVMPLLLAQDFHLGDSLRGVWLAVPALGSTTAALLIKRTRRALGSRRLLLAGTVCAAGGFFGIGVAATLPLLFVGCYLYGLGEGSMIPTLQDLVSELSPAASRGAVIAAWVGAARAGQTFGSLAFGAALEAYSPSAVYVVGGTVAAALVVVQVLVRNHLAPPRSAATTLA